MRINKWFGKLNIKFEIRWKKHYHHSMPWVMNKITRDSMMYGIGFMKVQWIRPYQFWKKGWWSYYKKFMKLKNPNTSGKDKV